MKRTLIATLAAVFAAAGANALSLTLDTDKASYTPGETIVITATLDTTGAPAGTTVALQVTWVDAIADALGVTGTFTFGSATQMVTSGSTTTGSNLTSFGGALPWTGPAQFGCVSAGPGAGNTCTILNQFVGATPFPPDPAVLVGTLNLQAVAPGLLSLGTATVNVFGATPVLTSNYQNAVVVPEPTTAALLGLGLLGLGIAGRRR